MTRQSSNEIDDRGRIKNGYDYGLQAWILDYVIQECGHPESMGPDCCNQRKYAGVDVRYMDRD